MYYGFDPDADVTARDIVHEHDGTRSTRFVALGDSLVAAAPDPATRKTIERMVDPAKAENDLDADVRLLERALATLESSRSP